MIRVRMPNMMVPTTGLIAGMEVQGFRYWPKYDPPDGNPEGDTKTMIGRHQSYSLAGYVDICMPDAAAKRVIFEHPDEVQEAEDPCPWCTEEVKVTEEAPTAEAPVKKKKPKKAGGRRKTR